MTVLCQCSLIFFKIIHQLIEKSLIIIKSKCHLRWLHIYFHKNNMVVKSHVSSYCGKTTHSFFYVVRFQWRSMLTCWSFVDIVKIKEWSHKCFLLVEFLVGSLSAGTCESLTLTDISGVMYGKHVWLNRHLVGGCRKCTSRSIHQSDIIYNKRNHQTSLVLPKKVY